MEYFIDPYGKKRLGQQIICKGCGKQFWTRADRLNQACSAVCRGKLKQTKVTCRCAQCDILFKRNKSKIKAAKSGLSFCSRECKDKAQKLGGIKEIMPPHFGTAAVADYRSFFKEEEFVCVRCGYHEFDCGVDIHHVDEDRTNNNMDNLIPLCKCCHVGLHNKRWKLEDLQGPRV